MYQSPELSKIYDDVRKFVKEHPCTVETAKQPYRPGMYSRPDDIHGEIPIIDYMNVFTHDSHEHSESGLNIQPLPQDNILICIDMQHDFCPELMKTEE